MGQEPDDKFQRLSSYAPGTRITVSRYMFRYRIANNANLAVILKINSAAEYPNVCFREYLTEKRIANLHQIYFVLLRVKSTSRRISRVRRNFLQ